MASDSPGGDRLRLSLRRRRLHRLAPRLFVLTDIGNEPDDQMSFVRLLLYSNELDIEGLVATTSTWQKEYPQPETLLAVLEALRRGAGKPGASTRPAGPTRRIAARARAAAGRTASAWRPSCKNEPSPGAVALLRAAQRNDPRPLWISVWGGANTLAEALMHARATLAPAAVDALVAKLRVYSISDQDDAGPWIRREFPRLFYIVKPSAPERRGVCLRHLDRHQRRCVLPQRRRRGRHAR